MTSRSSSRACFSTRRIFMSKSMKILFAASVVLNVLFAGIVIGTCSHGFKGKFGMRHEMREVVSEFPADKQDLVKNAMKELRASTKTTKAKLREKRQEVIEVLSAPEFDPQLFDRRMKELHTIMGRLGDQYAVTAKRLALNLDQDERKALAEVIMRKHGGPHFPKKGWDRGEDRPVPEGGGANDDRPQE